MNKESFHLQSIYFYEATYFVEQISFWIFSFLLKVS